MSGNRVESFQQILAQSPDDAFARYGLAMEYRQMGDTEQALAQFNELRARHPEYTAGYQMAAQLLMGMGDRVQAVERLQSGIAAARSSGNRHAVAEMEAMLEELESESR